MIKLSESMQDKRDAAMQSNKHGLETKEYSRFELFCIAFCLVTGVCMAMYAVEAILFS